MVAICYGLAFVMVGHSSWLGTPHVWAFIMVGHMS